MTYGDILRGNLPRTKAWTRGTSCQRR